MDTAPKLSDSIPPGSLPSITLMPVLMYDTDTGFGYGGKCFIYNSMRRGESSEVFLFNDTKGERWYKLGFPAHKYLLTLTWSQGALPRFEGKIWRNHDCTRDQT